MKTTLDLDDGLLAEAKAVAAKRRTTLKSMVEHALRREIQPAESDNPDPGKYEVGPLGILSIKRTGRNPKTKQIQQAIDRQYDEEDARVTDIATSKA